MLITEIDFAKFTNHTEDNRRGRWVAPELRVRAMARAFEQRDYWVNQYAEYAIEAKEYAAKGYIPERCVHGTYMWTDRDCACYACEDGWDGREHWQGYYEEELANLREVLRNLRKMQDICLAYPNHDPFSVEEAVQWYNAGHIWSIYADLIIG